MGPRAAGSLSNWLGYTPGAESAGRAVLPETATPERRRGCCSWDQRTTGISVCSRKQRPSVADGKGGEDDPDKRRTRAVGAGALEVAPSGGAGAGAPRPGVGFLLGMVIHKAALRLYVYIFNYLKIH